MKTKTPQKTSITFDASGKRIGRLSVRVADALRGKDTPTFVPNKVPNKTVVVYNTDKLDISAKKKEQKTYYAHSGYPGGLTEDSLGSLFARDSREVVRRAVYGMLPKNKLRDLFIVNLKLYKDSREN